MLDSRVWVWVECVGSERKEGDKDDRWRQGRLQGEHILEEEPRFI